MIPRRHVVGLRAGLDLPQHLDDLLVLHSRTNTVEILWGMGNPTSAIVTNRSLVVEVITP